MTSLIRLRGRTSYTPGRRQSVETIVFEPETDARRPKAPPVRIYLGTEPRQSRAERVFLWSVAKHRDRGRRYEVHLMKDLAGFERRDWTTGFTNFRFAVPHLAGGEGRAIYNDVDQIYLTDPAELFDLDLDGHGVLCTTPNETSVMLLDCARMAGVWPLEEVRRGHKKALIARMNDLPGLRGDLDPAWNARDGEYVEGESRLLHYTTLHTQPWAPDPARFVYRAHPQGGLWHALEREADAANFMLFTRSRPSRRYVELGELYRQMHEAGAAANALSAEKTFAGGSVNRHVGAIADLVARSGARTVLDYGAGKAGAYRPLPGESPDSPVKTMPAWGEAVRVHCYDPGYAPYARLPDTRFDGVITTDVLEHIPEEDIPWILDEMFSRARHFVYGAVACYPAKKTLPNGENAHCCVKDPEWWEARFRAAARHHPGVHWVMVARIKDWRGKKRTRRRSGGAAPDGRPPRVWVLADPRPGNANQAEGLAQALGYPYEVKRLAYAAPARLHNRLLGASLAGLSRPAARQLAAPWPELVIAAGRRTAPVARWIGRQATGAARVVQIGRKGGDTAHLFDAVVTPAFCGLAASPRRIETLLPITPFRVAGAPGADRGRPRITALVGGATARHRFDAATVDRLAGDLVRFAGEREADLLVLTSRRTGEQTTARLAQAVGGAGRVLRPDEVGDGYWQAIAEADALVVTGESESLLADAAAAGNPLHVYPLPEKPLTPWLRLGARIAARADARPKNDRATTRPQQRLEYFCARLIERGYVRPPRRLAALHAALYARGQARPFGEAWDSPPPAPLDEAARVAERLRELLGLPAATARKQDAPAAEAGDMRRAG